MDKKKKTTKKPRASKKDSNLTKDSLEYTDEIPSTTPTAVGDINNSQALIAKIDKWLQGQSVNSINTDRKRNLNTVSDYTTLQQCIIEFMDTFLLVGYNMDGQRVILQHSRNSRDQDALVELLRNIAILPIKPKDEDTMY